MMTTSFAYLPSLKIAARPAEADAPVLVEMSQDRFAHARGVPGNRYAIVNGTRKIDAATATLLVSFRPVGGLFLAGPDGP